MEWPDRFYQWKRGEGCPMCAAGRPEETEDGMRFFAGDVADAYLRRAAIQRGLSVVIWHGRHISEPTELSGEEAQAYWRELLIVGRAIEQVMRPIKLNYNILGNSVPHLHTHVVPRYRDDPRPLWPFPFPDPEPGPMPPSDLRSDAEKLRAAIAEHRPKPTRR